MSGHLARTLPHNAEVKRWVKQQPGCNYHCLRRTKRTDGINDDEFWHVLVLMFLHGVQLRARALKSRPDVGRGRGESGTIVTDIRDVGAHLEVPVLLHGDCYRPNRLATCSVFHSIELDRHDSEYKPIHQCRCSRAAPTCHHGPPLLSVLSKEAACCVPPFVLQAANLQLSGFDWQGKAQRRKTVFYTVQRHELTNYTIAVACRRFCAALCPAASVFERNSLMTPTVCEEHVVPGQRQEGKKDTSKRRVVPERHLCGFVTPFRAGLPPRALPHLVARRRRTHHVTRDRGTALPSMYPVFLPEGSTRPPDPNPAPRVPATPNSRCYADPPIKPHRNFLRNFCKLRKNRS
ncbi:hypothetical protein Bbelb_108380 [Branchiostoma belcheri]|nr:hypothetical protein Bbelb_108380 [Branchiostoma belcheri]